MHQMVGQTGGAANLVFPGPCLGISESQAAPAPVATGPGRKAARRLALWLECGEGGWQAVATRPSCMPATACMNKKAWRQELRVTPAEKATC
ncbi:hypothetical protein SAMN05216551_10860 [Chitinasiproducens palmae]|uniref:Uncharacterized protein n=1 Tax=Chitinasiproducens palmae TaxID=1770053 RepID=A0A1H2PR84_9BURK|nr:hypothetical protein SAMN05216551_10860 [Chitinasiproducens palmae]